MGDNIEPPEGCDAVALPVSLGMDAPIEAKMETLEVREGTSADRVDLGVNCEQVPRQSD